MSNINPYEPPSNYKTNESDSIILIHSKYSYLNFVLLNLVLIIPYEWMCSRNDHLFFINMLLPTVLIIIAQYPFINRVKKWLHKLLLFYLSMSAFLFLLGLILFWNEPVGLLPASSFLARLKAGFGILFYGHFFGIPYFPVVVLLNYVLKEFLFYKFDEV